MKKAVISILSFIVLVCFVFTAAYAEDAAMVVDLQGGAVYDDAEGKGKNVELMDFLAAGRRIKLADKSLIVLNYFSSGAREEINGPGTIIIGAESSVKEEGAEIKTAKVDYIPKQADVGVGGADHGGVVVMRDLNPTQPTVLLLALSDTAARSKPVKFRWRPVSGADKYRLTVTDVRDKTLLTFTTSKTEYSSKKKSLKSGMEIYWNVEALASGKVIAEGGGQFYILDKEKYNNVVLSEQYIDKNYPEGSTEALIAKAMLYKRYQLNDDARAVLLDLRKDHPRNRNIVEHIKSLRSNYSPE